MNKTLCLLILIVLLFNPGIAVAENSSHVHIAELIQPATKASILENEGCQNNTFYALLKDMQGTFSSAGTSLVQFESRDGVTWHPSKPALVSRRMIHWSDGTQEKVDQLERPQIWLKNGKPAMLFLAVRKGGHSYNVHVPLNADGIIAAGVCRRESRAELPWLAYGQKIAVLYLF